MKKNLLFLLMTVFTLGFVACSDDDDDDKDEVKDYTKEIAGVYSGNINVSIGGVPLDPSVNDIYITRIDDSKVNLELRNFEFTGILVGDITVLTTVSGDGSNLLSGTANQIEIMKTIPGGPLKADVAVSGKIVKNKADLIIDVTAPLMPGSPAQKILVTFKGDKK